MRTARLLFLSTITIAFAAGCSAAPEEPEPEKVATTEQPLAELGAAVGAVKAAYEFYKSAKDALNAHLPTPEEKILKLLAEYQGQFVALEKELDAIALDVKKLIHFSEEHYFLLQLQEAQGHRARARTAYDQIQAWLASGKTDTNVLADALNNSLLAANSLRDSTALFTRPGNTPGSPRVFDHRMALASYTYAVAVRMGVLMASDPDYRSKPHLRQEIGAHAQRVTDLIAAMRNGTRCDVRGDFNDYVGQYQVCSSCEDDSGVSSRLAGEAGQSNMPGCTSPVQGTWQHYVDARQYFEWNDRYRVGKGIGIPHLLGLENMLYGDAAEPNSGVILAPPPPPRRFVATHSNKCLDATNGYINVRACDGSSAQLFSVTGRGEIKIQDRCLSIGRFNTSDGGSVYLDECSGAPNQAWTVTASGELKARHGGKCLDVWGWWTHDGAPVVTWSCHGGTNQLWMSAPQPPKDWYVPRQPLPF
jgi:hypothetical protein